MYVYGCNRVGNQDHTHRFAMCDAGAIYLEKCPAQRFIPIYLVVGGAFGVYANISALVQSLCQQLKDPERERERSGALSYFCRVFESLISCFVVAWFIAGEFHPVLSVC